MPKKIKQNYHPKKYFEPKTIGQKEYCDSILSNDITICTGPSGTGKSLLAIALAAKHLDEKAMSRIVLSRPTISTGRGLGFLPGGVDEKMSPYLLPLYDHLKLFYNIGELQTMIGVASEESSPIIEIAPFEYMRGRSLHNCFVIIDEAQNATYEQLKMIITRFGQNCKMVINGDTQQCDIDSCALDRFADKLYNINNIGIVKMNKGDIVRNELITIILDRLDANLSI